ncbi:MAG: hypothetical protein K1X78_12640 [Verrucomicrobiaceae bacterium]|nr:hypothetical protein [Verrucomicrobiaceae bacterium]
MPDLHIRPHLLSALLGLALCGCSTIKRSVSDLHMPKMPDLSGVKKILPGSDDSTSADDPLVPFDPGIRLAKGHTLRLHIYEGAMDAREMFNGLALVDEHGVAKIGRIGSAKIGGQTLPEAVKMIESVCRVGGHAASQIHVHVVSVENVEIIAVTGNVKSPQHLPLSAAMRFSSAVTQCGGQRVPSGMAVYVTRDGVRKFFSHIGTADAWGTPRAGDIISLSADL